MFLMRETLRITSCDSCIARHEEISRELEASRNLLYNDTKMAALREMVAE